MVTLYVKRNEEGAPRGPVTSAGRGRGYSAGAEGSWRFPRGNASSIVCLFASFWSAERSQEAFGDGNYRGGWFLLDIFAGTVRPGCPAFARSPPAAATSLLAKSSTRGGAYSCGDRSCRLRPFLANQPRIVFTNRPTPAPGATNLPLRQRCRIEIILAAIGLVCIDTLLA